MLAVEKELRGQRIGSKLVKLCLDRMRRRFSESQAAIGPDFLTPQSEAFLGPVSMGCKDACLGLP